MRKGPNADPIEKEKTRERMKKLQEAGLNNLQIAQEVGCSNATVTRYLGVRFPRTHKPEPQEA